MASTKDELCSKKTLKKKIIGHLLKKCNKPGNTSGGTTIVKTLSSNLEKDTECWFDSIYLFLDDIIPVQNQIQSE